MIPVRVHPKLHTFIKWLDGEFQKVLWNLANILEYSWRSKKMYKNFLFSPDQISKAQNLKDLAHKNLLRLGWGLGLFLGLSQILTCISGETDITNLWALPEKNSCIWHIMEWLEWYLIPVLRLDNNHWSLYPTIQYQMF